MPGELLFDKGDWQSVLFGIELAVFVGFFLLCAVYPLVLFVRQVWRAVHS